MIRLLFTQTLFIHEHTTVNLKEGDIITETWKQGLLAEPEHGEVCLSDEQQTLGGKTLPGCSEESS